MPATPPTADALRTRASALRRLAASLAVCRALELHRRAGTDVWRGPLASACLDDLTTMRRQLLAAHDDLLHGARRLDRLAEEAEMVARR